MIHRGCDIPEALAHDVEQDVRARREADGALDLSCMRCAEGDA